MPKIVGLDIIKPVSPTLLHDIKNTIRTVPDFPKKGILFRDITPLLLDQEKFRYCVDAFAGRTRQKIDYVVSIESRGFIFGSALAYALGAGFVPIRKEGKLPWEKFSMSCNLEYGQAVLEVHADAMKKDSKVVLVDDVLATGGTVEAAIRLIERFHSEICGIYFLIELTGLKGREKLEGYPVYSLITY